MTTKTISPSALWNRVHAIPSETLCATAEEVRDLHPDNFNLHGLWSDIGRLRFMSLDAFLLEELQWAPMLERIADAIDYGDGEPIQGFYGAEVEPTQGFYEVEVEHYFKTKVVVEVTGIDPDLHENAEVAAMDAYGDKVNDAMLAAERTLNEVCEEVIIESSDVQIERLENCSACKGTGCDDTYPRNPCLRCDGEGWEAE